MRPQHATHRTIAVFGLNHWGKNFLRILARLAIPTIGVDTDADAISRLTKLYPGVRWSTDPARALADPSVHAVIIATPSSTHYAIAASALRHGKHVFVEKPLTQNAAQARSLTRLSRTRRRTLMVDHTFLYSEALGTLRTLMRQGKLGTIRDIRSVRVGPGIIRPDSSVLWDLAPHDLSILWFLTGTYPTGVIRVPPQSDMERAGTEATLRATLPHDVTAHIEISWVRRQKQRIVTVTGSRGMATASWDDGGETLTYTAHGKRAKRMLLPRTEPLEAAVRHFLSCVASGDTPRTGVLHALQITRMIAALSGKRGVFRAPAHRRPSRTAARGK